MLLKDNHTALLLFSRSAQAEAKSKRLFRRAKHNQKAAKGFIHRTIKTASQCGLPVHVCDEQVQTGNSFGEKLANAITQTFAKGYSKLIVIGNDCPGLTKLIVEKAAADLERQGCILGPTLKGGVYLIGLTAALFDNAAFQKIAWQTPSVFQELEALANITGSGVSILPPLDDINTASDVMAIAKTNPATDFWTYVLLDYLRNAVLPPHFTEITLTNGTVSSSGRRGPPMFRN